MLFCGNGDYTKASRLYVARTYIACLFMDYVQCYSSISVTSIGRAHTQCLLVYWRPRWVGSTREKCGDPAGGLITSSLAATFLGITTCPN